MAISLKTLVTPFHISSPESGHERLRAEEVPGWGAPAPQAHAGSLVASLTCGVRSFQLHSGPFARSPVGPVGHGHLILLPSVAFPVGNHITKDNAFYTQTKTLPPHPSLRKLLLEMRQRAHLIYPTGKTLRVKSPNCRSQKVLTHTESLLQKHHRIELDWQGQRPAVPGGVCRRAGVQIREWKAKSHKQERHQMRKNGGHVPNGPRSAGHHLRDGPSPGCRNRNRGVQSRVTHSRWHQNRSMGDPAGHVTCYPF